jgi:hypothetical protein
VAGSIALSVASRAEIDTCTLFQDACPRPPMKFLPSQLAYLTTDREARTNLRALGKYLLFLAGLATLYAVLFFGLCDSLIDPPAQILAPHGDL